MKNRVSLKYFVSYCLGKHFFDSNLPQTPSNLIALTFLVALRAFTLFNLKLQQLSPKIALLGNFFSDLLTEVEF